ncbi:hypothetical protein HO173_006774 [Letharia columbiana]|uniref:Probable guanine deaminase n=1 Tax=Letharia columbiana TaxID=112416 RepID=A0A8H6FUS4_9LECA|nr:uncharacterized protein HO173_006774 [Letharia columbiana]KAF6235145.1 hypothetical protein HO173_006774 [Letharia columbiana]
MPPPLLKRTLYTGTFVSTPTPTGLEILDNHALAVDAHGVITHRAALPPGGAATGYDDVVGWVGRNWGWDGGFEWVRPGGEGRGWWFPGFVDTHIHASQYPNVGIFGKTTLLDWLNTYTFPIESSLSSLTKARRVYSACVSRTLSHGTTTASYYATKHVASTNLLADVCLEKGQRAFIGRVCMDNDLNPDYLRDESPEQAVEDTKATIAHIDSIDPTHALITPIITPRFVPSCSSPLLSGLGALAKESALPIQTHLSENTSEIALVRRQFPAHDSYSHVYDTHGLLTPRTVLAHCVHLSLEERMLLKERKSKVSHCPVSNTSISSGLCPVRELLDDGIEVGLGTDVSGGYSSSILVAAREAAMVSRTLAALTVEETRSDEKEGQRGAEASDDVAAKHSTSAKDRKKLGVEECLYLATRGGAKCLGLEGKVGGFEVGMQWDAQLVELDAVDGEGGADDGGEGNGGPVELWGMETWGEKVAKWLFCGDDRNTKKVFVGGRLVHERR